MSACAYSENQHGFDIPDMSNLAANHINRILHSLTDLLADLFFALGVIFKNLNLSSVYLVDSFPRVVCNIFEYVGLN